MKRLLSKHAWKEASKTLGATCVVFAIVEALIRGSYLVRDSLVDYVPLPYVTVADYGPVPPWQERRSLIKPDELLVWRGQPSYERKYVDVFVPVHAQDELFAMRHAFLPSLPAALKDTPQWEISTNSEGFRDAEFPGEKPASVFRVLCLGDSWTFGSNVGQDEAYPQRLRTLLRSQFPGAHFEVLNLGVLGYASYNGKKLLETRALDLEPDLVVLAFAMNEPSMAGYREPPREPPGRVRSARQVLSGVWRVTSGNWELYRLLRYWALRVSWRPQSIGEDLKALSAAQRMFFETDDWEDERLGWVKSSLQDYEQYHREMIQMLRSRGIGVVLLYNEFWTESPYRQRLESLARAEGVPFVDSSSLLAASVEKIQQRLEERLDLGPSDEREITAGADAEVILRVYLDGRPVPQAVYVTGDHEKLAGFEPNTLAMYDDGTHGDQRAGDGVWSYPVRVAPDTRLFYVFTNSGAKGKWEGLDLPGLRRFRVPASAAGQRVYAPIDTFGKMYMRADLWHTDVAGNELIARAVLEQLKNDEDVKRYLARIGN